MPDNNDYNIIADDNPNNEGDMENYERELEAEKRRKEDLERKIREDLAGRRNINIRFEKQRFANKIMLKKLIEEWRQQRGEEVFDDPDLRSIIEDVEEYVSMDVAATHGYNMDVERDYDTGEITFEMAKNQLKPGVVKGAVEREGQKFDTILTKLLAYMDKLENDPPAKISEDVYQDRLLMAANLTMYFEGQRDGHLEAAPEGAILLDERNVDMKLDGGKDVDRSGEPLFPHDPSPNDTRQGMGNCYMLAPLGALAKSNPNAIKECMRDNGDGTVTVRFYQRFDPVDQPEEDRKDHAVFKPVFVTVNKKTPKNKSAQNCLWVAMIERAYAVAGFNLGIARIGGYTEPRPANLEERYEYYKQMPEKDRPTELADPWLFDKENNLKIQKAPYSSIGSGGVALKVMDHILGPNHQMQEKVNDGVIHAASLELMYGQMQRLVGKKDPEMAKQLADAMKDLSVEQKLENMIEAAAFLYDGTKEYVPNLYEIRLDKNGRLKSFPRSSMKNILTDYCNILKDEIYREKTTENPKPFSIAEAVENSVNEKFGKKAPAKNHPLYDLRKALLDDRQEMARKYGEEYPEAYLALYEDMKQVLRAGGVVCASTANPKEKRSKFGLFYKHVYSIVGMGEYQDEDGNRHKMIYVRDPNGGTIGTEYDFSKKPPEPIEDHSTLREGITGVELRHFVEGFESVHVAKKVDKPVVRQEKHPLTPAAASRYHRLLDKKFLELRGSKASLIPAFQEEFEALNESLIIFERKELGLAIGSEMSEISAANLLKNCRRLKESYIARRGEDGICLKTVRHIEKLVKLMKSGVLHPEKELPKILSGGVLYKDKPLERMLDAYGVDELGKGAEFDLKEAKELAGVASGADPIGLKSSTQYAGIRKTLEELQKFAKELSEGKTAMNFSNYLTGLGRVESACNEYLSYKRNQRGADGEGRIIPVSGREKARIEAAEKIKAYAAQKREAVGKEYFKLLLADKLYQDTQYDLKTSARGRSKDILDVRDSKEFHDLTKNMNRDKMAELLRKPEEMKQFAKDYLAARNETEMERYVERQKTLLYEKIEKVRGDGREKAMGDTLAKLIYGCFCSQFLNVQGREQILSQESKYVEAIKETGIYDYLMNERLGEDLPAYLEQKEGSQILSVCLRETAEVMIHNEMHPPRKNEIKPNEAAPNLV